MSVPWNRLTREEAEVYLENQRELGYNLIQVMVIHSETTLNVYGNRPFADEDITKPVLMGTVNGFWQHADFIIKKAAEKGLYLGLVPVWALWSVKAGRSTPGNVYGKWLAERWKDHPNIVCLIGGDKRGSDKTEVWLQLANAIREVIRPN